MQKQETVVGELLSLTFRAVLFLGIKEDNVLFSRLRIPFRPIVALLGSPNDDSSFSRLVFLVFWPRRHALFPFRLVDVVSSVQLLLVGQTGNKQKEGH